MRFGSVCSGIEAASVAWEPLGWKAAWFSEIEPFPCTVLAHHYPEVPNLGDMTQIPALVALGEVDAPDVLCGGTPCQAFSVAGLRKSLDDARGNLSLTFCEIANAIDHARAARGEQPCIVFWENVPGVLSTKDNAFGCFLAGLAGEDVPLEPAGGKWTDAGAVLGPARAVAWRILDAQYFGLAQRRRRVFVVASARDDFDPAAVLFEFDGVRRDSAPSREAGQRVAPSLAGGTGGGSGHQYRQKGNEDAVVSVQAFGGNRTSGAIEVAPALLAQPGSGWKGDFESETFVTQPVAEPMTFDWQAGGGGTDTSFRGKSRSYVTDPPGRTRALTSCKTLAVAHAFDARQSDVIQYGDKTGPLDTDGHTVGVLAFDTTQITSAANYSKPKPGDPCHPLAAGAHAPAIAFSSKDHGADATADLAPTLRAMNHADSHANGGGQMAVAIQDVRAVNKAQNGRGWNDDGVAYTVDTHATQGVAIGADCFNGSLTGDVAATMGTSGSSQNASGPTLLQAMQVRRLTPRECERLQGFPDEYTLIPWRGKPASECPDGPRYKALGNSWAVPVVRWIGRRIDTLATLV